MNEWREHVIVEHDEGTFRFEFFKFRKPLPNEYSFEFGSFKYALNEGAEGVILLIPMTQLTTVVGEQIEELMNSYLLLKSSGLDLSFEVPLDQ